MNSRSGFFLLPRELRDIVYTYYLSVDGGYVCDTDELIQGKLHRCIKQADGQPLELSFAYTCKTVAAEMKLLTLGVNTITFSTFFSDDLCFLAGTFSKLRTDFLDNLRSTIFHYSGDSMIGRVYSELAATYPQFVPVLDHIKKVTNRKDPHNIPDNYGEALSSYREFVKHALQLASTHYKGELVRGADRLWRKLGARPEDIRRIDPLRIVHCSVQPWDIPSYDNVMELASYFNPSRSAEQLAKFLGDSSETKILRQLRQGDRSRYRLSAAASAIRFLDSLEEKERKSIRRIILNEDKESVADSPSHARGLIPFCQENPLLRVERRVNLWRNVFQPDQGAEDPHARVFDPFLGERDEDISLGPRQITWNVATWVMEALALRSAGMPPDSFSLVLDGNPDVRLCEDILQEVVQRDIAWQLAKDEACRQGTLTPLSWIERRGPNSSRSFGSYAGYFQCYTFEDFPTAMEKIAANESVVRFNFNIGVPRNVGKLVEKNKSYKDFSWGWHFTVLDSSEIVVPHPGWKNILLENVIPEHEFRNKGPEMFKTGHGDGTR